MKINNKKKSQIKWFIFLFSILIFYIIETYIIEKSYAFIFIYIIINLNIYFWMMENYKLYTKKRIISYSLSNFR